MELNITKNGIDKNKEEDHYCPILEDIQPLTEDVQIMYRIPIEVYQYHHEFKTTL
jgi:hypothetical protein